MPRSVPSHVLAALLAGSLTGSLQPSPDATWYGLVIVFTSLSSAGSTTQVRCAPGLACPAPSRADSRPPGARLVVRSLFVSAVQTWWCGWSISGQIHAMSSGRSRLAACCPGQNGSSVWSTPSTPPSPSLSWALTG